MVRALNFIGTMTDLRAEELEDTAASPELALSADSDAEFEKSSVYGDYDEPEAMTPIVTPVKQ